MSHVIWPKDQERLRKSFQDSAPFNHLVIDDFLDSQLASEVSSEFPEFSSPIWYSYENQIEDKRAMNSWDRFQKNTYRLFAYLNSPECLRELERITGIPELHPDVGLNGGGLHAHKRGGKLNVHLDYSIHPKLELERRLNLIIYLSPRWDASWGGGLQLWSHDAENEAPGRCEKTVDNVFNRAVLFDTTQNSWHGLPDPLQCPEGVVRQSLAIYYLTDPRAEASRRGKALFAPHMDQKNNPEVMELIRRRSGIESANEVYRKK
ncbi:MAG: 2OG-Fe(II) oxygenase [Bdellovibrionaceae bacterium]|nr:2OG-Fe(II) oxygenase [Pseudobdellovibrionaceae bacterium]